MSEFSDYYLDEITWVPTDDWPFEDLDIHAGIEAANRLAPAGCEWVYSRKGEPGYYLVHQCKDDKEGDDA